MSRTIINKADEKPYPEKVGDTSKNVGSKKNITWMMNQSLIHETYIKLVKKLKRCPTTLEISKEVDLSFKTIDKHIKQLKFEPQKSPLRTLTPDVIMAIYTSAIKGQSASQKLWLQVMEGWKEKTESEETITAKNVDMSMFTDFGLERLKRGDNLEDVLLDPKSIKQNAIQDTNRS